MHFNKKFTRVVAALCSLSTAVGPVLAAAPVYKVYIPDLKVAGEPAVKRTSLLETSYSQLEHSAYAGDHVNDLQRPLTIRNKGTAAIPLQFSISNPAYQIKQTDCPTTLPVGGSCVVNLNFDAPPLATPFGTTEGSLFVNKGTTTEEEVLYHGKLINPLGLAANVPLAPLVGSSYAPFNFSSNFSFKDLGLFDPLKLSWALSGPVPAGMTLYQGVLQGTPTSQNPASFVLTASYDGNSVQQTYTLTPRQAGSLVAPELTILSDTALGTTATKTVSIQNTGTVALTLSTPDTANALSTVFLTNDTCSNQSIPAGQTCTVNINHHPLQAEVVANSSFLWTATPSELGVAPAFTTTPITAQVQTSTTNPLQFSAAPSLLPSIAGVYYELDLNTLLVNPNATTPPPVNITAQSLTPVAPITPVVWTATQLPAGMALNGSMLSGYTTNAGTSSIKFQASSNGVVIEKTIPLTVQTANISLALSSTKLNGHAKHLPLKSTLTVSNTGQVPLFFAKELLTSTPPQNLSIDWTPCHSKVLAVGQNCAATLSYNPLQIENGTFDIVVPFHTASNKATANMRNSLTPYQSTFALEMPQKTTSVTYQALSPLAFKPYPDVINADIGTPYTYNFANDLIFNIADYTPTSVRWDVSINDFNGMHFDPLTGVISGTPLSLTLPTSFTVTATLPTGFSVSKTYTLQFVKHELQVSTQTLDFGTTYLSSSKTLSYVVYNIGNVAETIGNPLLVGAIADSLITTNCPTVLAAAASCNVQIEYRPSTTGDLLGTYAKFTAAAVPTVQVQGFAAAAVSVAIPPQDLSVGEPFSVNLKSYFTTVINTTSTWAADGLPTGLTLNPATGVVSGTPTAAPASGTSTHTLTISYRANPLLPLQRLYTPIVFNYKDFSWNISKTNVAFNQGTFEGQPTTGWLNTPQTEVLTVTNTGNQPLALTNPVLSASDLATVTSFATYSSVSTCNALVAPAATCTITLSYTPTAEHAALSVNLPVVSDHTTKTVALQFTAKNPLTLPTADVIVYTGTNAAVQLDPLLKIGTANLSAQSPSNITWTTTGTLPAGLSASAHALTGLVSAPAGTASTITLTASYANNTISAPFTIKVQEPLLTPAAVPTQTVWLGVQKQVILTFTAPSSNTQATSLGTVSQTSASNAAITSSTTHNCSSVAPGATCQATVSLDVPVSATAALGAQQIGLAFAQTYGSESLSVPVSLPLLVATPLTLQQPANLTLLADHNITPLDYTTLASYLPNPALNTDLFTWTMTGLPAGLTFTPSNQQISGSPTTAGTSTATLTISYQGITISRSFNIAIVQPTLTVTPSQANAPLYFGDTLTQTFTFQALNGGNVVSTPTLSIPAALGTYSTTCTTGLKPTGYSCTATVVLHPTSSTATSLVANLSIAIEGLTTTALLNHSFLNPLALPSQETWQVLTGQAQALENFSTLLTDARTSSAKTAPVTWGISSSTATVAIDAQGQASISAPVGSGSFTVSATKQGATLSRTYAYQASAWPISLTPTVANGHNGYPNANLHTFALKNTSSTAIALPASAIALLDSNTLDLTTPTLTTDACSATALSAAATCSFKAGVGSKDLNTAFTYTPQVNFLWTPQPTTKPTRKVQFTHTASPVSATLSSPLSMATIADQIAVRGAPFSAPLASKITNLADASASYTWTSTGLPAGLTLGSTGTITGTTTAAPSTYLVQITATYQTPLGLTLSATKTFNVEVIEVNVSLAGVDFGLVYPNTGTVSTSATIVNNGSTAIDLGTTTFSSPLFGILSADLGTCTTVAAGSACGITINLQPTSTGVLTDLATLPLRYKGVSVGSTTAPVTATIISPLSLATTLPPAYAKTPYSFDLNTLLSHNVDFAPLPGVQWTYGALPAGWTISAAGVLTGTPVDATLLTFPITATYKGYSVSANLPLAPSLLTMTVAGDLFYGVVFTNTAPITKTLSITNTSPVALTFAPTLATPLGTSLITGNGCIAVSPSGTCTITVTYAPTSAAAFYSNTLTLGYGVFTATHSTPVPLSATPTNPLSFSATLSTPVIGLSHTQNYSSNISINPAVEAFITPSLLKWTVSAGAVDAGLTFNTTTGVLTGVATTPVVATYTLTASYKGNSISRTFTHTPRVWQMTSSTPSVNFGTVYRTASSTAQTVTLTNTSYLSGGSTPTTASFYPTAGAALTTTDPAIALSANTCSGIVQTGNVWANNATCSFTLTYSPTATSSATLSNSVVIKLGNASGTPSIITIPLTGAAANPLTLDASDLTTAATGAPYSASLASRLTSALGATTGATWTATNLPTGLTLNTSTGVLSGTPTTAADTTITLSATLNGNTVSASVFIRIVNLTLTATPQPLDFGTLYAKWNTSDRVLTITNPTANTLNLSVTPPASTSAYLSTVANTCTSLAPAQTCNITYRYAPRTAADVLAATNLSMTVSYGTLSATSAIALAANPQAIATPISLTAPATRTIVQTVPVPTWDLTSAAIFIPNPSLDPTLMSWSVTGLPSGLTFDSTTHVITGTLNASNVQGTLPLTLTVSYLGASSSAPFSLIVLPATITASPSPLNFGTIYPGASKTLTTTFTLPNGGTLSGAPVATLADFPGTATSTCTAGTKPAGHTCTTTITVAPTSGALGAKSGQVSLSTAGSTGTVSIAATLAAPLILADQETWSLLGTASQVLEDFSTLLSDARTGDVSPTTWTISSPTATTLSINSAGVATIQLSAAAATTGTFTVNATKNYATVSKTYNYTFSPNFRTAGVSSTLAVQGYTTNIPLTYTATKDIKGTSASAILTDIATTDTTTFTLVSDTCAAANLPTATTCVATVNVKSTSANPPAAALTTNRPFQYAPQPTSKPTRLITLADNITWTFTLPNPLTFAAIPTQKVYKAIPFSAAIAPYVSNSANATATYTWTATGLPTGLNIDSATGIISGSASAVDGSYVATITATIITPNGATLTTSKTATFTVANISLSLSALDFGTIYPNTTGPTQVLTLTNNGTQTVSISAPVFEATTLATFSQTASTCTTNLAPAASCTRTYRINPGTNGALTILASVPFSHGATPVGTATTPVTAVLLNPLGINNALPAAYDKTPYVANINGLLTHNIDSSPLTGATWTTSGLPAGWTLTSTGVLTGTPTSTATLSFPVSATYKGYTVNGTLTLTPNALTLSATPLSLGTVYTNSTPATGTIIITNTSAISLSASAFATNSPATTTITANTCTNVAPSATCSFTVSYAPTTAGTYTDTLTIQYGSVSNTHSMTAAITATPTNPLSLGAFSPSDALNVPYSNNLKTLLSSAAETVDTTLITWSSSGTLPAGLSFNPTTALFSGTATQFTRTDWTLTATYKGNTISKLYSINVRRLQGTLTPATTDLGSLYAQSSPITKTYTFQNTSTYFTGGGTSIAMVPSTSAITITPPDSRLAIANSTCTGSINSAALCTFDVITTPSASTAPLNSTITLKVGSGTTVTQTLTSPLTATFNNPLSLSAAPLPNALKGSPYSLNITPRLTNANGATTGAVWTVSGLPAGLTFNSSTNTISGTPTVEVDAPVTFTATLNGNTISSTLTLAVISLDLQMTTSPVSFGTLYARWQTGSQTLTLTNNTTRTMFTTQEQPNISYLVVSSDTCADAGSIAPSASCTISYSYKPQTTADTLAAATLTINKYVADKSSSQTASFSSTLLTQTNPLVLTTPANITTLQHHPMTSVDYTANGSLIAGLQVPAGASFVWNLTGLPTGMTFNPTTQVLSGTPTIAGTYTATLSYSLLDQTKTATFTITVQPATITATSSTINSYPNTPTTSTISFTLPNGGNITSLPSFTLTPIASVSSGTSTATTCTTGLKPAGYSCTATLKTTLNMNVGTNATVSASLSIPGFSAGTFARVNITNPATFADATPWYLFGTTTPQNLGNFSTYLTDARGDTTTPLWAVSTTATNASFSIDTAGLLTVTPTGTGSANFTVTATKANGVVATWIYTVIINPSPMTVFTVAPPGYLGYDNLNSSTTTFTNTGNTPLQLAATATSVDPLTTDTLTTTLGTTTCSSTTLTVNQSCTVSLNSKSLSTASGPINLTYAYTYSPQPFANPSLRFSVPLTATATATFTNPVSIATIPTQNIYQNVPVSLDLDVYASNIKDASATYTWTATALPAGLSLNASTGVISGTPTAATGSYSITVTAAHTTALGIVLTASKTFSLNLQKMQVTLSTLDFGTSYPDATTLPTRVLTLTNTGSATASFGAFALDANPITQITRTSSSCGTLAPAASCTMTFKLLPTTSGVVVANLNLDILAGATPIYTATTPVAAILAQPLTFTPATLTAYDKTPFSQNVNTALSHYSLGNNLAAAWTANSYPAGWSISSTGTITGTPSSLATLTLSTTGAYSGYSATGTHSLVVNPVSLSSSGSLAYGSVYSNNGATSRTITLTNTTSTTLSSITPAMITAAPVVSFTNNTCSSLAPSATCTFDVAFNPTTPGAYNNTLRISYGVATPTHSLTLPLTATVVNPLALTSSTLNPIIGITGNRWFHYNLTSAIETLDPVTIDKSTIAWSYTGAFPAGITLDTATGNVSGTATAEEATVATLTATYKGNSISRAFTFRTQVYDATSDVSAINFGTVYNNTTSVTQRVTLTNASHYALSSTIATPPFFGTPNFTTSNPQVVIANNTCTGTFSAPCYFDVMLTPKTNQAVNATAQVRIGTSKGIPYTLLIPISATVANPLTLNAATLPAGLTGTAYSSFDFKTLLQAANTPITGALWTYSSIPAGMALDGTTGVLYGTPSAEFNSNITVTATLNGNSVSQTYNLQVYSTATTLTNNLGYAAVATNWDQQTRSLTITNPTTRTLTLSATLPSAVSAYYSRNASSTCGTSLASGATCKLDYTYAPTTTAQFLNGYSIPLIATTDNGQFSATTNVPITGSSYNPLSLSTIFGDQVFVNVPMTYDLQARNLLPANVDKTGTSWAGSSASVNANGMVSLSPTTSAPITFTAKATLRGNTTTQSYTINPIATSFTVVPSYASVNFGPVYANSTPMDIYLTLRNPGSYAVDLGSNATFGFSYNTATQPFTVVNNTCASISLAPAATCTFTVRYAPTALINAVATTLSVPVYKNGKQMSVATVSLTGSAITPLVAYPNIGQPVYKVPYSWNLYSSFASVLEPITYAWSSLTFSGTLPPGLSFNPATGIISGTPTSTATGSFTATFSYKGNTISQTFNLAPRQLLTTMSDTGHAFGTVYNNSGTYYKTFTLTNVSTYSSPIQLNSDPITSASLSANYLSIINNTCTGSRILAYGETCSYTVAFNPTDAWNGLPYFQTTIGVPFGLNGVNVDTFNINLYGASTNPMTFSTIPNQTFSVGVPVSFDMRPYLTVANNPSAPSSAMSWWFGGTLPAGLTMNNGIISGTPTTAITNLPFQIAASYNGNASASNAFALSVATPVSYTPPVGSPSLHGSSLNPSSLGNIFVEQTVTVPYVWTFNTAVQITTAPTLQSGTAGLYISATNCPAPGTVVAAGSSCQANVTLTGNGASMGAFTRTLTLGVGTNGTTYVNSTVYVAGNVLNPLKTYGQEPIWSLAPNTNLIPYAGGWIYNDLYPTATPVTITLEPVGSYLPVYVNGAWITSNSTDGLFNNYTVKFTVTKQTSPPVSATVNFNVNVRGTSSFGVAVAAQAGMYPGYPTQTVQYTLTNNYPISITPVADANNWKEIDYYYWDAITSTNATNCITPLVRYAACTYLRNVNPGTAGPGADFYFGVNRAFTYVPQPTNRPWHSTTAFIPAQGGVAAGAPGASPNHNTTGLYTAQTLGNYPFSVASYIDRTQPMVYCDYFDGTDPARYCGWGNVYPSFQPLVLYNAAINSTYTPGQYYTLSAHPQNYMYVDNSGFLRGVANGDYALNLSLTLTYNVTLPSGRVFTYSVPFYPIAAVGSTDNGNGGYNPSVDGPNGDGNTGGTGGTGGGDTGGGGDTVGGEGE